MINSLRNFAKTKIAGIFIFIIIIPFVFWGMGSVFNTGNTNNIAKINNKSISTNDFMDYLNQSGIATEVIRDNLEKNIIEEILSRLISTTLLDLEIKELSMSLSNQSLIKSIKKNKNFLDENGVFQRTIYEKFLLLNNLTAAMYEIKLKDKSLQKQLFDYIGAGTVAPKFLTNKIYKEENRKVEIEYINLNNIYKKEEEFKIIEIKKFLDENKDLLMEDFIDFSYIIITPKNLIGLDEFNENFFNKIDEIDSKISNNTTFNSIIDEINIKPIDVTNYTLSETKRTIEDKIFLLKGDEIGIFEEKDSFILYNINKIESKHPNIDDEKSRKQILNLLSKKNKYELNKKILKEIDEKKFNDSSFAKLGKEFIEKDILISKNDDKKFERNSIEIIYSLPKNSFTLITDDKENIYVTKVVDFKEVSMDIDQEKTNEFSIKYNSINRRSFLKTYDYLLNDKYKVTINQKTVDRIKNYFK